MRQTSIPIQLQVIFQNIQKVDVFNLEEDQCDLLVNSTVDKPFIFEINY